VAPNFPPPPVIAAQAGFLDRSQSGVSRLHDQAGDPFILQIRVRGGQTRPRHFHHPAVDLDPVAVRVEEVKGVAAAPADEALLASLRGVHVGAADDLDAARAHVIEGQQPVLA
jgi:hypothetical protein